MTDRRLNDATPEEWDEAFDALQQQIENSFYDNDSLLDEKALDAHYTKLKIQPMTYSMENGLDPMQHTILKYVTRFRDKGGKRDLLAALKTLNMLIEYEYGDANN